MRSVAIAFLLCAAGLAHSQGSTSPQAALPQPGQLFQTPPLQSPGKHQFKWQHPDQSHRFFIPQPPGVLNPAKPSINSGIDSGILRKPQGFAQPPSHPAPHSNIYPDLKIQPIEIAKLEGAFANLRPKAEPIPTVFPGATLEPIPITWDEFRMVPVGAGSFNP
jgi:hypothetical protein